MYENSDLSYITKETVLSRYSQEQIFCIAFDIKEIKLNEYLLSPFREDNNPGCWFEYRDDNTLMFRDFGSGYDRPIDCFDAIAIKYGIKSFKETLHFIMSKEFNTDEVIPLPKVTKNSSSKTIKTIEFTPRNYYNYDKEYWQKYEISRKNLDDDKVFPVDDITFFRDEYSFKKRIYTLAYAFTDFDSNNKKIYLPYDKQKFISTCNRNDVGNIKQIDWYASKLIITKSYKDCRVLRNLGLNCIWFQNEGCKPDDEILFSLINGFEDIIIFYDNDSAGILSSQRISDYISYQGFNSRYLHLPEYLLEKNIKDSSDLLLYNKQELIQFLKANNLYESP